MDRYKSLLEMFKEELKKQGFVKSGSAFYVKKDNNWGLIHFQKSRRSDRDLTPFTIELGVCSEKIRSLLNKSILMPKIEECHWRLRIGELMEHGKDHWWELDPFTDLDSLYNDIKALLILEGMPKLFANISDQNLEQAWLAGISNGLNDFERLIYLTTLLKVYDRPNLKDVAMQLKIYAIDQPIEDVAESHLRKLKVQF